MKLNYALIGKRITHCRKSNGLTQAVLAEKAEISTTYMSSIERAKSIPSTEVIMRLAIALDTTPDEFLVGTVRHSENARWKSVAERLRTMNDKQLDMAESFLTWLSHGDVPDHG